MIASLLIRLTKVISGARPVWTKAIETDRQRIFFANHTSHLDFMVVWSALPSRLREKTRPVAGADYWGKGPVRRYLSAKVLNGILIERSPASASPEEKRKAASDGIERMAEENGNRLFDHRVP